MTPNESERVLVELVNSLVESLQSIAAEDWLDTGDIDDCIKNTSLKGLRETIKYDTLIAREALEKYREWQEKHDTE